MRVSRETIYAAFWSKVSAAVIDNSVVTSLPTAFTTTNRRLKHWDDVPANMQPALFMIEHRQMVKQTKGIPPTWDLELELFVYDNCGGVSGAIPGQRLNYLLDAIDNALAAPYDGGYQTLGGLVSHCWISGTIEIYEGYTGMMDQSVAIVPVAIRVPDSSGPV